LKFSEINQMLQQAGLVATPENLGILAGVKNRDEAFYHLDVWKRDQENARQMAASPIVGMAGSLADIDTVAALGLTLLSGGAGSTFARALIGKRAVQFSGLMARASDVSRGAVFESRVANAAAGGGLFATVDAVGQTADTSHTWQYDATGMSTLFGAAAGVIGPLRRAQAAAPAVPPRNVFTAAPEAPQATPSMIPADAFQMPEPPNKVTALEVLQSAPFDVQAAIKRGRAPSVAELSRFSLEDRVTIAMGRALDRAEGGRSARFVNEYLSATPGASALEAARAGYGPAFAEALQGIPYTRNYDELVQAVHTHIGDSGVRVQGLEAADPDTLKATVQFVQKLRQEFAFDARVLVARADDPKAAASIVSLGENTIVIQLGLKGSLENSARAVTTSGHEFGHLIGGRELVRAVRNGDSELVAALRAAYTDELKRSADTAGLGVTDAVSMVGRFGNNSEAAAKVRGSTEEVLGTKSGVESETYHRNFDEWMAQQFVRWGQEAVKEVGEAGLAGLSAGKSAFFNALPKPFQKVLALVLDRWQKIFTSLKGLEVLKPDSTFSQWMEGIADRKGLDTGAVWQPTVLDAPATALDGPVLAASAAPAPTPIRSASVEPTRSEAPVPAPPPAPAEVSPNSPALLRWSESVLGKGWYSLYDKAQAFGGRVADTMAQWVVNGAGSDAVSATAHARVAKLELDARLAGFENGVRDELGWSMPDRVFRGSQYREEYKALMSQVYDDLMQKHRAHLRDEKLPVNPDARIERLSKLYAETGYAEKALGYLQTAERTGADAVRKSPWYIPMRTSWDSISEGIRTKRFTEADVKSLLRAQVVGMYNGVDAVKAQRVADSLYSGIRERAAGKYAATQHFEGLTGDELEAAMIDAGIPQIEIDSVLGRYQTAANDASRERSLRHRLDWDFSVQVPSASGSITMKDLVDGNIPRALEQYGRNVSGQYGLGMQGYKNGQDVRRAIDAAVVELQDRGASAAELAEARGMLENTAHSLLGRRVGEETPHLLRAMSEISASVVLRNSAVYNIGELARIAHYAGVARTVQSLFNRGFHKTLGEIKNHADLQDMQSILANRHIADGRWRSVITHTEDNFDLPSGWVEGAHAVGQATRFFNGMEWTRRKLSNTLAQICIADLHQAVRGNADTAARLEKYGFSPALLERIRVEVQAKGDHPGTWNKSVQADAEAAMHNLMDQINQANRLGELPAFMQFSTFGKALFPYLSFVGGAFNKVLRKGLADEDMAGAVQLVLWQVSAGAGSEMIRNLLAGRDAGDSGQQNFVLRSMTNAPMSSWFGYALDTATAPMQSGFAALSAVQRVIQAGSDPSLSHTVGAVPLLSVTPGVVLLSKILEE
jgi:hypothetical protein